MRKALLAGLLVLIGFVNPVWADDQWDVSGQIRHRFESDDKDFGNTKYTNFNLLRTRLNVLFSPTEGVTGFVQLQDSRVFGEETSTLSDGSADNFDLHQGYIEVTDLFGAPLDLKLGRMEVIYGPQRLVGAVGWHNIGRSFDGVILTVRTKYVSADLFQFSEVDSLIVGDRGDKNFFGAYMDIHTTERYTNQVFLLWQRAVPSCRLNRYTFGFYSNGSFGGFYHETEFAYQGGEITTAVKEDVEAFMAGLNLGYKAADVSFKPAGSIGVDFLSGDGDLTDDKFKVFDTLYATNHKYYGFMDYFISIPANTFGRGLVDWHVRLSAKPQTDTTTKLAVHYFRSHKEETLSGGSTSKAFGTEADLTVGYKYNDALTLTGGASVFWPGDVFKEMRGDRTTAWFYVMTTLTI
ncbi:MAG: alginate export family protein [Candidatus Latescibacterota bacterium]|nr:MAG: alginate export family protein [Candidatus Latescibacterota bacterium]